MVYPQGKMDPKTSEHPPTEQEVSWEVVRPQDLPALLEYTLEQAVTQQLTMASSAVGLLQSNAPHHIDRRDSILTDLERNLFSASLQIDTIRQILRHPDQLLPIDRITYPKPIINLDLVKPPSPQQPSSTI